MKDYLTKAQHYRDQASNMRSLVDTEDKGQ
jgi:hypothetical protein